MSRFTFIASDYELPEIDLSGIVKGTVKELREMNLNPRPELSFNLDKLCDDVKAIFIPDGVDTGRLTISRCTNPPYGIEEYIKKRYTYWLGGSFSINWTNQLQEYLNTNIQEGKPIELWSIWFGWHEFEEMLYRKIELSKINSCDFELFDQRDCCFIIEGIGG